MQRYADYAILIFLKNSVIILTKKSMSLWIVGIRKSNALINKNKALITKIALFFFCYNKLELWTSKLKIKTLRKKTSQAANCFVIE